MKRSSLPFRNIVALIGAFCISFNLTSITHELGHALAVRLGGGVAERITLNSFSFSYTRYADVGRDRAFAAAGGALFGSLAGLTAWLFTRRSRSALALPLRLCGMLAFSVNGLYWLTDPLLNMKGDASTLLRLGWPPWVIVTVGGGLLLVGLLLGNPDPSRFGRPSNRFLCPAAGHPVGRDSALPGDGRSLQHPPPRSPRPFSLGAGGPGRGIGRVDLGVA